MGTEFEAPLKNSFLVGAQTCPRKVDHSYLFNFLRFDDNMDVPFDAPFGTKGLPNRGSPVITPASAIMLLSHIAPLPDRQEWQHTVRICRYSELRHIHNLCRHALNALND
jgi:hypothetical protein